MRRSLARNRRASHLGAILATFGLVAAALVMSTAPAHAAGSPVDVNSRAENVSVGGTVSGGYAYAGFCEDGNFGGQYFLTFANSNGTQRTASVLIDGVPVAVYTVAASGSSDASDGYSAVDDTYTFSIVLDSGTVLFSKEFSCLPPGHGVVPPTFPVTGCSDFSPTFAVQGGDSSTYQDLRIVATHEDDLEPSVDQPVVSGSSATIATPERPGEWTYFLTLRDTVGEPVYAGGESHTIELPCIDPEPVTYTYLIPPAPGAEYVDDDPSVDGDACYNEDRLIPLNTDQWVYSAPDCAPVLTIIAEDSVFTDGSTAYTYPKPVDVYLPPTETPEPSPSPSESASPGPTPSASPSPVPSASTSSHPTSSPTSVPVSPRGALAATGLNTPILAIVGVALAVMLAGASAFFVRRARRQE